MAATNTEGGSHTAGLERRLSTLHDDNVNERQSYRRKSAPPKPKVASTTKGGCFGFCAPLPPPEEVDVVLVGGGIMSVTLGMLLKQLQPNWKIVLFERLGACAEESSNGWNNAGTGHSALCEPNYTPSKGDTVDISKAITVNENWQLSRQWWAKLAKDGLLSDPKKFIDTTPHMTFVHTEDHIDWLKKRYTALKDHPLFKGMEYSDDKKKIAEWAPLLLEGRDPNEKIACSRVPYGTDVDFGALTKELAVGFMKSGGNVLLYHTVSNLQKEKDGKWLVTVKKNDVGHGCNQYRAKFVFCGAGGWALPLLQKSGIPEIKGFMGFPISGEFLVCQKPEVVDKHPAKIYGRAAIGAPPMSVPHLDARIIGGKHMILFGPYAGFSPRFLKTGGLMDLIKSVKYHNLIPAAAAGLQNMDLTIYLLQQLLASKKQKLAVLKEFYPDANGDDWTLVTAGQRVQVMKSDPKKVGILQFGTEVVASADGSIAGLLGASPGASTGVQVALDVMAKCFPKEMKDWQPKIKMMIPSYGTRLSDSPSLAASLLTSTSQALQLK